MGGKRTSIEPFHMCGSLESVVLSKHKHPLISLICTSTLGIYQITQQGKGGICLFLYFIVYAFLVWPFLLTAEVCFHL